MAMHTTTVRFTADQWARIVAECDRLGMQKATYIREAVIFHFGYRHAEDRIVVIERRVGALAERVDKVARLLTKVTERVIGHR